MNELFANRQWVDDTTIGLILLLWFVGGLACIGRPRTYRLGTCILGSGVLVVLVMTAMRLA